MQRPALSLLMAAAAAFALAACGGGGNNAANHSINQLHDPKAAATAPLPTSLASPLPAANLPALATGGVGATPSADVVIVKAGDTLGAIAAQNGVSVADLEAYNGITDPTALKIGGQIRIPKPGQTPTPPGTPAPSSTSTPASGGPALSTPGPQPSAPSGPVQIPATGGAPSGSSTPPASATSAAIASATAAGSSAAGGAGENYDVKSGDNACKIATDHKITVAELAAANNLSTAQITRLTVGQVLKVPPSTGHVGCT